MITKTIVSTRTELEALENGSALTFEGLAPSDENIEAIYGWAEHFTKVKVRNAYIVSGSLMNLAYGLTGDNAYPEENCTLVCFKLDDFEEPMKLAIPRFQIGGRWFDDIVENNARREGRGGAK